MRTLALAAALGVLLAHAQADDLRPPKKIIEWDGNEPNTEYLRANIERMERVPFDGLVFHTSGANFTWEIWGSRRFTLAEFQKPLAELRDTRFRRFTDRFLRVNVTPGDVDWFDDAAWSIVRDNFGIAARIAKEGGCKGFMFDTEQYQKSLFAYFGQREHDKKSFADYRAKVRQRGEQWMREVNRHFPDITILLTFGYEVAQPRQGQLDRSRVEYGLLADFLDGLLAACSKETQIVDAWESSYGFKTEPQFRKAYERTKAGADKWTAAREPYLRHLQVGFGIWLDNDWQRFGWSARDPSKNYFTPAGFERAVRAALRVSNRYVWIYAEKPHWWTGADLPQAYIDALAKARKSERLNP